MSAPTKNHGFAINPKRLPGVVKSLGDSGFLQCGADFLHPQYLFGKTTMDNDGTTHLVTMIFALFLVDSLDDLWKMMSFQFSGSVFF